LIYFNEASHPYTGPIPILSLENVSMQYFLNNHYKQYGSLMNKYIEREVTLNLSTIDIHSFRFDRLYYFSQFGAYHFIQEIIHKAGGLAKVKMIQTVEPIPNQ